jgi:hypothetical protein
MPLLWTRNREIFDTIGVWGKDDMYLKFLGNLRELGLNPGFSTVKDSYVVDKQGTYGGYMTPEKRRNIDGHSSRQSSVPPKIPNGPNSNNPKWVEGLEMMYEERDVYCSSVVDAVASVFESFTDFMVTSSDRYTEILKTKTPAGLSSSRASRFMEEKTLRDRLHAMKLSNSSSSSSSSSSTTSATLSTSSSMDETLMDDDNERIKRFLELKNKVTIKYKGSKEYQKMKKDYKFLGDYFNSLMDETGFIPFYDNQESPQRTTFSDFVKLKDHISPEQFVLLIHSMDKEDKKIHSILQDANMENMFTYATIQIDTKNYKGSYPVQCIQGIPEAILYDEVYLLKWISIVWQAKALESSKAFNNPQNEKLPSLYQLCSSAWVAKSFIMMTEYENCSSRYDHFFLQNVVLKSLIPLSKRLKKNVKKSTSDGKEEGSGDNNTESSENEEEEEEMSTSDPENDQVVT